MMNLELVEQLRQVTAGSLNGTISFPEVVGNLLQIGIGSYHVDFIRNEETFYSRKNESHVESIPKLWNSMGNSFDASEIGRAVLASQTEGQSFPAFVDRVVQAGCVGYFAYLDGRKVVYLGKLGEEHVENFPQ